MSGLDMSLDIEGMAALSQALAGLSAIQTHQLLDSLGMEVESQTKHRVRFEKREPTGKRWAEWSEDYAKTRHRGHSLLINEGHLLNSITYENTGNEVVVGSNLIYAARHQFGKDGKGARPYLGISTENRNDLISIANDFVSQVAL